MTRSNVLTTTSARSRIGAVNLPTGFCRAEPRRAALQRLIGDGVGERYFRENNTRADGLDVELTDIDYLDIGL